MNNGFIGLIIGFITGIIFKDINKSKSINSINSINQINSTNTSEFPDIKRNPKAEVLTGKNPDKQEDDNIYHEIKG